MTLLYAAVAMVVLLATGIGVAVSIALDLSMLYGALGAWGVLLFLAVPALIALGSFAAGDSRYRG